MINVTRFFRSKVAIAAAALALTAFGSLAGAKSASAANPDLDITRFGTVPATKTVVVELRNRTAATGLGFYTAIYICNSNTWACQTYSRYTPAMAVNQDSLVSVATFSGANWVYACVDTHPTIALLSNRIAESNEANNCRFEAIPAIP